MRAQKGYGPPCPHCGHIVSRRAGRGNGWAEPNDDYLRYKVCVGCEERFTTVEVVVPPDKTTFARLDYAGREANRERWRRLHATTTKWFGARSDSDRLYVTVKVVPALTHRKYCSRGHSWTEKNLYYNVSDRKARCRVCRDAVRHAYYLKHRDTWNTQRRAA
jgi:hypothetical protein